jgi:pimeloyl-ACP methyl ester carboxylesterase
VWLLATLLLGSRPQVPQAVRPLASAESLSIEVWEASEPVVLILGIAGSAFGFRKLLPLLHAAGYRSIVVEPLGVGSSARPEGANYSLTAQAARIAAVLDALHVHDAILIAHSIGASEALRLAYQRPDLVKGLVSIEGGPADAAVTPRFRRALQFASWIKLFGGIRLMRREIRGWLIASSGDSTWVTDAVVQAYTAGATRDLDATLKAYRAMANAREPERLAPHLAGIRCPVVLVVGGAPHEGEVRPQDVELLRRGLRSFVLDSVPGAGHFIYEEQPSAVVAAMARLGGARHAASSDGRGEHVRYGKSPRHR